MKIQGNTKISKDLGQIRSLVEGSPDYLILCHDNPDPDSLSSAMALQHLFLRLCGVQSKIVCGGFVGRAENQEMIKCLKIRLYAASRIKWSKYDDRVALVDTQPWTGNNSLPAGLVPRLVFDHHPKRKRTVASFLRVSPEYGATATILTEYLWATGPVPKPVATALSYGISSETQDLGREASPADMDAYLSLFPIANQKQLSRIKHPPLRSSYFTLLNRALSRAFTCRQVVGVHLGEVENPDIIHEVADLFVRMERMRWSLVTGRFRDRLILSVRTTNEKGSAGSLARRMLRGKGTAGGHDRMAGGMVDIGQLNEPIVGEIESELTRRFIAFVTKKNGVLRPLI